MKDKIAKVQSQCNGGDSAAERRKKGEEVVSATGQLGESASPQEEIAFLSFFWKMELHKNTSNTQTPQPSGFLYFLHFGFDIFNWPYGSWD